MGAELVFIKSLITDFIIQAFGIAILPRIFGLDIMTFDALLHCPGVYSKIGKLGSVR